MNRSRTRRSTHWFVAPLGVALLAVAGCGDNTAEVRGTITVDGTPIVEGMISFEPVDGQGTTTGAAIKDGKYELVGKAAATPGPKIVRIVGLRKTGKMVEAGPPAPKGSMIEQLEKCVPKHYNDESKLRVEITPGKVNTHDFALESKLPPPTP